MTTFIVSPSDSDETILKNINKDTRFVINPDHYNGSTTGYPNAKAHIQGTTYLFEQLIEEFPNTIFLSDVLIETDLPNYVWFPFCCFNIVFNFSNREIFPILDSPRPKTCNIIGGKTRIQRTLASFWLANNYPLDQLTYHTHENDDIGQIIEWIHHSAYYNKRHLNPRKFLLNTFIDRISSDNGYNNADRAIEYLLPEHIGKSYISLQTESNGVEGRMKLTEKTIQSFVGGTMPLHLGNWRANHACSSIGFESFDGVFDTSHLNSDDIYYRTIGGLENNKEFLIDHEAVEQTWYNNLDKIKHNQHLSYDITYWYEHFASEFSMVKEAFSAKNMDFRGWKYFFSYINQ